MALANLGRREEAQAALQGLERALDHMPLTVIDDVESLDSVHSGALENGER